MAAIWTISQLDRRTSDGFVTTAHWQCTAQDGDFSGRVYSTCSWADGQPVIPYADLTQEEVLGWIWESGVDKDATEAAVLAQIEAQKNPVSATGVPW
jgi:hypothetical protein